jgi:hypothetical protein
LKLFDIIFLHSLKQKKFSKVLDFENGISKDKKDKIEGNEFKALFNE